MFGLAGFPQSQSLQSHTDFKSWLVAFCRMVILRKSRESSVYCGAGPFSWAIASDEFLEHSLQRCFVRVDGVRKFSQLDFLQKFLLGDQLVTHFLGSALLAGRVQRWHCLPAERRLLVEMSFSACILHNEMHASGLRAACWKGQQWESGLKILGN